MEESQDKGKPVSSLVEVDHHPLMRDEDEEDDDSDEGFEVLEQDVRALSEIDHEIEQLKVQRCYDSTFTGSGSGTAKRLKIRLRIRIQRWVFQTFFVCFTQPF